MPEASKPVVQPRLLSLFSGAGGLDFGLEAAGFAHGVGVELDQDCCLTLRASRPGWEVVERDIHRAPSAMLLVLAGTERRADTLLIGGPPCQPFSKSGWWANGDSLRLADPRASTLGAYLRVLRESLPRAFLLENVEGLAYRGKNEGLRLLLDEVRAVNRDCGTAYDPVVLRVEATDYGVPQMRHRVIVVGIRDGTRFRLPPRTHGGGLGLEPHRTAWDAIGDLGLGNEDVRLRGKWAELLPTIPEGQNYLFHTDRGGGLPLFGWRRRYWSFLLKLAKDRPSWTVQAQPGPATGPFHWDNRRLTIRELCRLQTFPDDVTIVGNRNSAVRQVGNAVPSLLAEVLGRALLEQAFGHPPIATPLKLLPPRRLPVPPATPAAAVPAHFRAMAGTHEAHPGTGKGYRRQRMAAEAA
jgi:DNA (cytosine-5)-methyltransferase 1